MLAQKQRLWRSRPTLSSVAVLSMKHAPVSCVQQWFELSSGYFMITVIGWGCWNAYFMLVLCLFYLFFNLNFKHPVTNNNKQHVPVFRYCVCLTFQVQNVYAILAHIIFATPNEVNHRMTRPARETYKGFVLTNDSHLIIFIFQVGLKLIIFSLNCPCRAGLLADYVK